MTRERSIILTAGRATRAGELAPDGCKALVEVGGNPMIKWQCDALADGDPIIVCRSEHVDMLKDYGQTVVNDRGRGAADALASALPLVDGPVIVAYADTFFLGDDIPEGTDWVGVADADGGRRWDVVRDHYVAYEHVAEGWVARVCVGLYAFSDPRRLGKIIEHLTLRHAVTQPEMGLAPALNIYNPWREVHIPSWQDVGSVEAIKAWSMA